MVQLIEKYPVLVSLLATLVVVVATVFTTRRWGGNRRTRLRVAWDSTRMVTVESSNKLEILLNGSVVREPHLVNIVMHNAGPNDISGSNFDRSMPLKLAVRGANIVDMLEQQDDRLPQIVSDGGGSLLIGPGLLSTKVLRSTAFITEGKPEGIEFGRLVNVDVRLVSMRSFESIRMSDLREFAWQGLACLLAGALLSLSWLVFAR